MKIAVVSPRVNRRGGTERQTLALVNYLSRGHEVHLFAASAEGIERAVRWHRVWAIPFPGAAHYASFLLHNCLWRWLRRLFLGERFDLLVATAGDVLAGEVIVSHFCQRRRLEDLRQRRYRLPAYGLRQRLRRWHIWSGTRLAEAVERRAYASPRLRAAVAVSRLAAADLQRYYRLARAPEVVYDAVDLATFNPRARTLLRAAARQELGLGPQQRVFLFVGGDWERKGVPNLLEAFARGGFPEEIQLWIVGHGEAGFYRSRYRDLPRLHFFPPSDEILRYHAAADFFICPTLYDTFGLAPLEAMASGLPVIVSAWAGMAERLRDGETARLLQRPEDPQDILQAMRWALANQEQLRLLGERGAAFAAGCGEAELGQRMEEILSSLAAAPNDKAAT